MNLNILYPHFMFFGEPFSMPTPATGYSAANVITGSRQLRYKHGSSTTTLTFKTDVRTIRGEERQGNYLYVGGMKLLCSTQNCDIEVKGADDNAFSVNVTTETQAGVNLASLIGRERDDYVFKLAGNFKDYWQVKFTVAAAQVHELRKLYIGQYFDFGVEPDAPMSTEYNIDTKRRHLRDFEIRWYGVTNEKIQFFNERIYRHRQYNPVILYSKDWSGILTGENVVHAMIDEMDVSPVMHNLNAVTIKFSELI